MAKRPAGKLRIIGGEWRSRVIEFDDSGAVRPTPDRVRQTLFDWLAPDIEGTRCLDLFAGSGALGMEALSRGAGHCTFCETGPRQVGFIKSSLLALKARAHDVVMIDGLYYISQTWHRYHVVFLDPPFGSNLALRALGDLPKVLAPDNNRIYLEWPEKARPELPPGYRCLREKQAGQVCFGLLTYAHP
jgi:16S rRNA (guanine966-N2)-methyltransferase